MSGLELVRNLDAPPPLSLVPRYPCRTRSIPGMVPEISLHTHSQILVGRGFTILLSIFIYTNNLHSANVFVPSNLCAGTTLSICLTKNEIKELTLKVHYAAQARTLSEMGIRYTLRPDGSPVVLHSTLEDMMAVSIQKSHQPNFSSLDQ